MNDLDEEVLTRLIMKGALAKAIIDFRKLKWLDVVETLEHKMADMEGDQG